MTDDSWLRNFLSTLSFHFVLINPRVSFSLKYDITHSSVLRDTHFPFLQSFLRANTFFSSMSWIAGVYNDESCWYDFQFCMRVTLRYLRQFCLFLFSLCSIYSSPFFILSFLFWVKRVFSLFHLFSFFFSSLICPCKSFGHFQTFVGFLKFCLKS